MLKYSYKGFIIWVGFFLGGGGFEKKTGQVFWVKKGKMSIFATKQEKKNDNVCEKVKRQHKLIKKTKPNTVKNKIAWQKIQFKKKVGHNFSS